MVPAEGETVISPRRTRTTPYVAALVAALIAAVLTAPVTSGQVAAAAEVVPSAAPPAPGSLTARPGDRVVDLSWTLPAGAETVVVRRLQGAGAPATPSGGVAVYSGAGTSTRDIAGLANGRAYAYAAWALDADGTPGPAATVVATPVPAPATALSVGVSAGSVTYGRTVRVSSRLIRVSDTVGVPGVPVVLYQRNSGALRWSRVGVFTTRDGGGVTVERVPARNVEYTFRHAGSPYSSASASGVRRVVVVPVVAARLGRAAARVGSTVKLTGTVLAPHTGQTVHLQRWNGRAWVTATTQRTDRTGAFTFTVRHSGRGSWSYRVNKPADAVNRAATSRTLAFEAYTLHTYSVTAKGRVVVDMKAFARQAAAIYADRRGWAASHRRFTRVPSGGAFTLVLAEASKVPTFSSVCSTTYSCRVGRYVIINQNRWRRGTTEFRSNGGTLTGYRHMVVNHETGHWLGNGHAYCGGKGRLAPVMMQQSKGLAGCRPNPWPTRAEIRANS